MEFREIVVCTSHHSLNRFGLLNRSSDSFSNTWETDRVQTWTKVRQTHDRQVFPCRNTAAKSFLERLLNAVSINGCMSCRENWAFRV